MVILFKYAIRHKEQNRLMEWSISKVQYDATHYLSLDEGGQVWFTNTKQEAEDVLSQNGCRGTFNSPMIWFNTVPYLEVVKISIKCD